MLCGSLARVIDRSSSMNPARKIDCPLSTTPYKLSYPYSTIQDIQSDLPTKSPDKYQRSAQPNLSNYTLSNLCFQTTLLGVDKFKDAVYMKETLREIEREERS